MLRCSVAVARWGTERDKGLISRDLSPTIAPNAKSTVGIADGIENNGQVKVPVNQLLGKQEIIEWE